MTQIDRRTGLVGNTGIKEPVKATTTANITLSGEQTIDGISCVDGDRVLVKNQTTTANNGVYEVDTGTWSRTKDCDGAYDLKNGTLIFVRQGTTNGNKIFKCSATDPITIGTTSLSFVVVDIEFSGNVQTVWGGTAGGTADALTLTPATAVTSLTSGLTLLFKSGAANNTTAVTIAVSGLAATTAQLNGAAMVAGDIEANRWYIAVYEAGGTFQVSKIGIPALIHALTIDGAITASGAWTHSGTVTMSGKSIIQANASIAAHATTMDPWSLGTYVTATGAAVNFTGMAAAPQAGAEVEIYMNAAHTFTDGAVFEVDGDANWTAEAGDRVLLRAKSTTVFTVHPRKKTGQSVSALGAGQIWQDVAASRAVNTIYQNTTGRPIVANISCSRGTAGTVTLLVDDVTPPVVVISQQTSSGATVSVSAIIPPNHYYELDESDATKVYWAELR